jgi:CheY-like chemotaxis protein
MAVVLVADDDRDMLALYGAILEELGHQTRLQLVIAGELEAEDAAGVDALIVDLHTERDHLAGLEAIERIRAHPATRELPIILATAAGKDVRRLSKRLKVLGVAVLLKPFRIDALRDVLGQVLLSG